MQIYPSVETVLSRPVDFLSPRCLVFYYSIPPIHFAQEIHFLPPSRLLNPILMIFYCRIIRIMLKYMENLELRGHLWT